YTSFLPFLLWGKLVSESCRLGGPDSYGLFEPHVHPSFLKPGLCWTWQTSAQSRSRRESSPLLSLKAWMPQVREYYLLVTGSEL
uniref:Uncharacterized protein n=1 Tax=Monodon monoceros TaxID=40151 RepID=A0A8C6F4I9_MONMO